MYVVMRKLVFFALLGILLLLSTSSCGDVVRAIKIYNDIDTTLVVVSWNDPTEDVEYSCDENSQMYYRLESGGTVEYTVCLIYRELFSFCICRDLTGDKRDLNTMEDCDLKRNITYSKEGFIEHFLIRDEVMQERGYVLVLDSLILGLKSPE